jgi:hypothetical protein
LINSTGECQFDVFIQAQKKKYRVMQLERNQLGRLSDQTGYMSESLHADDYLELDVNSIFVEHHQNRKKQMLCRFSSRLKCRKTKPNIPSGLICLNNIFVLLPTITHTHIFSSIK